MLILGIDPGLALTGYGVVEHRNHLSRCLEWGVLETAPDRPLPDRLLLLETQLLELLDRYVFDGAAVEQLFFSRNVTTAFAVGQARGVVLLSLARRGIGIREYTPQQIKQAVTGSGRAAKAQVQQMVMRLSGLRELPRPDDAADGVAAALCWIHDAPLRAGLEQLQKKSGKK